MTYYVYNIINQNTGHIYIGRTRNPNQWDTHKHFLEMNQHFNRLMQKHYNNGHSFQFKVIEQNEDASHIAERAISIINELDATNPLKGYNSYFDGQGLGKKDVKLDVYDEDLAFFYMENNKSTALKEFDITSNVFEYRMRRIGLSLDDNIPISTYDCLYHFCAYEVILSAEPISASNLMDRCINTYDISQRLRPTPHKISKNLQAMKIPQIKKSGLIHFTGNIN